MWLLARANAERGRLHIVCNCSTMNPREVCALHRKHHYDLILLDLQMPGMDGFQVMEGLKTNAADAYLPVLVITAQPGHKLRALQAGAKDFISKPFDLVEVRPASATCWKCACCTRNSRTTTRCSNRRCRSAPPNCAKAKRAIAA
jgi:CheY-like chemotaxis protein